MFRAVITLHCLKHASIAGRCLSYAKCELQPKLYDGNNDQSLSIAFVKSLMTATARAAISFKRFRASAVPLDFPLKHGESYARDPCDLHRARIPPL